MAISNTRSNGETAESKLKDVFAEMGASREEIIAAMAGSNMVVEGVQRHAGHDIVLPEGMEFPKGIEVLKRAIRDETTTTESRHEFNAAYDDLCVAVFKAVRQLFGFSIQLGISRGFFGTSPPHMSNVKVGVDERGVPITMSVPDGRLGLPGIYDEENQVGYIQIRDGSEENIQYVFAVVLKRHQPVVDELMRLARHYLDTESIYRGKIVNAHMEFINFDSYDMGTLVLAEQTRHDLDTLVILPVEEPELADRMALPRNRTSILYGNYGTGKSLALTEIAIRASRAGWTVFVLKDNDSLDSVIETAKIYQPALVLVEDVDTQLGGGRSMGMNRVLNAMDGIGKRDRIHTVMTTNNPSNIHEAALRPGRTSVVIKFDALDGEGLETLFKKIDVQYDESIEWNVLAGDFAHLMPCYMTEARSRLGVELEARGNTQATERDVRLAIGSLNAHYELQQNATSGMQTTSSIEAMIGISVSRAMTAWADEAISSCAKNY